MISIPYTLPQKELVKLFSQICLRPIASMLLMQQHKIFEDAISQVVVIEQVKIQDDKIKGKKWEGYTKIKTQTDKVMPTNKVLTQKEEDAKPIIKKDEEPKWNQKFERDTRPPRNFTPLLESLQDILKKILDHNLITLLELWPDEMQNKNTKWYRENEFCNYHR